MKRSTHSALAHAFDEARFGRERTLDLRSSLPTAADAEARVEAWLRERQVSVGGDVLVITGRGRSSANGIAVVRPAVEKRLSRLRRQGVVTHVQEHTAGSFIVTLAPVRALLGATNRRKDPPAPDALPAALSALPAATRALLRDLAARSLDALGAPRTDALVNDEMLHQFSRLARAIEPGPNRDERLKAAIRAALADFSDERD